MVPQKTWVAEHFWPDPKISEAFLMGLEVSFLGDSCILESKFFSSGYQSLKFALRSQTFQSSWVHVIELR